MIHAKCCLTNLPGGRTMPRLSLLLLSNVLAGAFLLAGRPGAPVSAEGAAAKPDDKPPPEKVAPEEKNLHPPAPMPVSPTRLESAIRRGIDFLLKDQNKDGSWGSPTRTKNLNIYAPVPGAHHAFQTAVTSLCVSALIEVDDGSEAVHQAIERGEKFLFENLPLARRATADAIYNVWTHGYGIQALVHMHNRLPGDKERQRKIKEMIREQYQLLGRYETVEGGWGYYDFGAGTQRPDASSTSFVDAAVLIELHNAKAVGVEPPEKVTRRAIESLESQRLPNFCYLYGTYLKERPVMGINRPGGSLGRSQACNLALRLWGSKVITDKVITTWLDRLISRQGWLDMGRKRPIPHESHMQVAGYFYYFGHYYGALCMLQLPKEERAFYQDHLAHILMERQEADGTWWDFPLYNYHQQYGTAFALMSLKCCRKEDGGRKP
jgi:hypothetical protein